MSIEHMFIRCHGFLLPSLTVYMLTEICRQIRGLSKIPPHIMVIVVVLFYIYPRLLLNTASQPLGKPTSVICAHANQSPAP
ncbi:hypothetical protein B0T17DRAFT_49301 [Bombardia bombarda]|uniref:Uncharacterized protein n=1 Tax=Bombardia bombarda TaxID=252184 RepID=A0AA39XM93_9PEZI|nr:hypothetical protein B0T17DRAFT_49301 [Bombardia bombarda]